jgi:hypothetical protein
MKDHLIYHELESIARWHVGYVDILSILRCCFLTSPQEAHLLAIGQELIQRTHGLNVPIL